MQKSTEINELVKALCEFQKEMHSVSMDGKNPFFKNKYATLKNIILESKPILTKYGLVVSQIIEGEGSVSTIVMHSSGQFIQGDPVTLKPTKNDPQGIGSAITYARRYSYSSALGIVADEDDDGNLASQNKKVEKTKTVNMANDKMHEINNTEIVDTITTKQEKELKAMAANNGWTKDTYLEQIGKLGYQKSADILQQDYETLVETFSKEPNNEQSLF